MKYYITIFFKQTWVLRVRFFCDEFGQRRVTACFLSYIESYQFTLRTLYVISRTGGALTLTMNERMTKAVTGLTETSATNLDDFDKFVSNLVHVSNEMYLCCSVMAKRLYMCKEVKANIILFILSKSGHTFLAGELKK